MGTGEAVQKAIYSTLRANSALALLLATDALEGSPSAPAVYDEPPPQQEASEDEAYFPYVVIGDEVASNWDTDSHDGQENVVTIHAWDRREGRLRVKQILDAIYDALHDVQIFVAEHHVVYCYWEFRETVPDPDPMTQHGVTRFRIVTQQS